MHCESVEGLWLKGEATFATKSFRDTEQQPVIPLNEKKNHKMSPKQLDQTKNISLTTIDMYIPSTAYQGSVVCYSRNSQVGPRIITI